jgi:hypothetical protein
MPEWKRPDTVNRGKENKHPLFIEHEMERRERKKSIM